MSSGGVKYLLVIVDNFTKFVELYALRRATTNVTLKRIQQYIKDHGKPNNILTDNGTQFTSKKWTRGLEVLGIKPRFTAIRNPCANIAERWNRQLGNLFRVFVQEKHTKWATCVKIITCLLYTYRTSGKESERRSQQYRREIKWSFSRDCLLYTSRCV